MSKTSLIIIMLSTIVDRLMMTRRTRHGFFYTLDDRRLYTTDDGTEANRNFQFFEAFFLPAGNNQKLLEGCQRSLSLARIFCATDNSFVPIVFVCFLLTHAQGTDGEVWSVL